MKGTLHTDLYFQTAGVTPVVTPFNAEDVELDRFDFVASVQRGLASNVTGSSGGNRATATLSIAVNAEGAAPKIAAIPITLYGPGDVLNINAQQILRRFPAPGSHDAMANVVAHVEFDLPELPWMFSPAPAAGAPLQPWLRLVVVRAAAARILGNAPGLPPILQVDGKELPDPADSWAWAHGQVQGNTQSVPIEERLSDTRAAQNLSRLLSNRHLQPGVRYIAAVVPVFESGVLAGLDRPLRETGGFGWSFGADAEVQLPAYDHWEFTTNGAEKDFEALARKLRGAKAPYGVGRRVIDTSAAFGGAARPAGTPGNLLTLTTALVSPAAPPADHVEQQWDDSRRQIMRGKVSPPEGDGTNSPELLPRVNPRLYAQFQRGLPTLPEGDVTAFDDNWFTGINTNPVDRIAAGLGTRVIQMDQEELMQAAWLQIGEIRKVNRQISQIQLGRYVGAVLHQKIFAKLDTGALTQSLRPVHGKLRVDAQATLFARVRNSCVPEAAMTGAFSRTALMRSGVTGNAMIAGGLLMQSGNFRDFQIPRTELSGIRAFRAQQAIDVAGAVLAQRLNIAQRQLTPEFLANRLTVKSTVASKMARPLAEWSVKPGSINLQERAVTHLTTLVEGKDLTQISPQEAERLGRLLTVIAQIGSKAAIQSALPQLDMLQKRLGKPADPVALADNLLGVPDLRRQRLDRFPELGGGSKKGPRSGGMASSRFASTHTTEMVTGVKALTTLSYAEFAGNLAAIVQGMGSAHTTFDTSLPMLQVDRNLILNSVAPARTATAYVKGRLAAHVSSWFDLSWFDNGRVEPIMAAPQFPRPMYEALAEYDIDWLVPGLSSIPLSDFVTVLETNPRFTEAFMVGLSDEMGRELLWRDYPTDQRGTYFHYFWGMADKELQRDIHRFGAGALGSHIAGGTGASGGAQGRAVLVIRAELIRRYPDLVVLALRGSGSDPASVTFSDPPLAPNKGAMLFRALVRPDTLCVGFDLSVDELRSSASPWWFMVGEHPTAPKFGLDFGNGGGNRVNRNALTWGHFPGAANGFLPGAAGLRIIDGDQEFGWGDSSAANAHAMLQNPVRAMFHAPKLIGGA